MTGVRGQDMMKHCRSGQRKPGQKGVLQTVWDISTVQDKKVRTGQQSKSMGQKEIYEGEDQLSTRQVGTKPHMASQKRKGMVRRCSERIGYRT
jgi:hypothetical protein